ncbi:hypothetical protein Tco_0617454 [Tanacetum coccineum]
MLQSGFERLQQVLTYGRISYYSFPCSILSIEKDRKTSQQYHDVPTTSWENPIWKHGTRYQATYSKSPYIMASILCAPSLKSFDDQSNDTVLKAKSDTVKNPKLNVNTKTSILSARSYPTKDPQCSTHIHGSINAVTIHPKQQSDSHDDEPTESEEEEKDSLENTNTNPSASPDPSIVKKNDDSRKEEPEAGGSKVIFDEKKLGSS